MNENQREESGTLKFYCGSIAGPIKTTKELLLPSVAHMVGGEIRDTMFDSFVFLPSPNWVYDWGTENGGMAAHKKSDWLEYITDFQFANGHNMNALEETIGEVKQALGRSDYKPGVFMSMFCPVKSVTSFGEVDGRNLNFSNLEDRKAAVKWMVDEQLRQWEAGHYKNIKISGFYWFHEGMSYDPEKQDIIFYEDEQPVMYYKDEQLIDVLRYITNYIRSIGYITIWSPFFRAYGFNHWREYGFDRATMQANYFTGGSPNFGGLERLHHIARYKKLYGLGAEIELEDMKKRNITVTKEYLKIGAKFGYMEGCNLYYMGGGPDVVSALCNSEDKYTRSLYDDLYRFIKRKLKWGDMVFE